MKCLNTRIAVVPARVINSVQRVAFSNPRRNNDRTRNDDIHKYSKYTKSRDTDYRIMNAKCMLIICIALK